MRDKEQLYVLLAIICLIGAVMFAIHIVNFVESGKTKPPPRHPIVAGYMEKVDGNYNLTIVEAYNPGLGLDDVEVVVLNKSYYVIFRQSLNYLVDNESSDIVFYDKDKDNAVSKGDVLTIKSNVVSQAYELNLISISKNFVSYLYIWRD
ncbi:MAG: hypothetical protein QME47_06650 [Candidatus Thermoplasmatota archaeon]|nr:hypothetical protein [Candidatus Thermoplasmatota archaeon]